MGAPAVLKQTGTGTIAWFADWTQTPFQLGLALIMSGAAGTASVDVTFDNISGVGIDTNGVASSSATWFSVIALTASNATANHTTPVQAVRLNLATAVATSVATLTIVQAGLNNAF